MATSPPTMIDAAEQILRLHGALRNAQDELIDATASVTAHRTGVVKDPRAWDKLAEKHGQFYSLLCGAVGLSTRSPDYKTAAEEAKKKAGITGPIADVKIGEVAGTSIRDTINWLAFNVGDRPDIEGRNLVSIPKPPGMEGSWNFAALTSVDPDETGVDVNIAKQLDKATAQVIEGLKNELSEHNKIKPDDWTADDSTKKRQLEDKISALEKIAKTQQTVPSATPPFYHKVHGFEMLVQQTDDSVGRVDEDWLERRQRDRGVGVWNSSRHSEAVHGLFDGPRFKVMVTPYEDPKTGKLVVMGNVTRIPLYSKAGIQRAAGQFLGSYYEPLYKGTPELEDDPDKPIYELDDKGDPKIDPNTKKPIQKMENGKPLFKPKKDAEGNFVFKRDDKGIIYKPLTPEERKDLLKKHPFPLGSLPAGYPDHSLRFFMDLLTLNIRMGGPGVGGVGRNPSPPPSLIINDPVEFQRICDAMNAKTAGVGTTFKEKFISEMDTHWLHANNRADKNIRNPKIFAKFQQMKVMKALMDELNMPHKEPLAKEDIAAFYKKMNQPGNKALRDRFKKMAEKELTAAEKKQALEEFAKGTPEEVATREEELFQIAFMDISGTSTASPDAPELDINGKPPTSADDMAIQEQNNDDALDVLIANKKINAKDMEEDKVVFGADENEEEDTVQVDPEKREEFLINHSESMLAAQLGLESDPQKMLALTAQKVGSMSTDEKVKLIKELLENKGSVLKESADGKLSVGQPEPKVKEALDNRSVQKEIDALSPDALLERLADLVDPGSAAGEKIEKIVENYNPDPNEQLKYCKELYKEVKLAEKKTGTPQMVQITSKNPLQTTITNANDAVLKQIQAKQQQVKAAATINMNKM